jgi:hypothetical protein
MSLGPHMSAWIAARINEARDILNNERSTDSQRALARRFLEQHAHS